MVVKDGDSLTLGTTRRSNSTICPDHTPGVLTTEGINAQGRRPDLHRHPSWAAAAIAAGSQVAEQSVTRRRTRSRRCKGVQVNLQIHSWAEPERLSRRRRARARGAAQEPQAGEPHPFVDPATWTARAKLAQENAAKAVAKETAEGGVGKVTKQRNSGRRMASRETCSPFRFCAPVYCGGSGFCVTPGAPERRTTDTALISSGLQLAFEGRHRAAASVLDRLSSTVARSDPNR